MSKAVRNNRGTGKTVPIHQPNEGSQLPEVGLCIPHYSSTSSRYRSGLSWPSLKLWPSVQMPSGNDASNLIGMTGCSIGPATC